MTFVGGFRRLVLAPTVKKRAEAYRCTEPAAIASFQLERINALWTDYIARIPYYQGLRATREGAKKFASLAEFAERVPSTTRSAVRRHRLEMTDPRGNAAFWRLTGGTTSEPIQLPAWHSETRYVRPDIWFARGWFGIDPSSRLFLIWGHSHLLGSGARGRLNAWKRETLDRAFGWRRESAYDLSQETLRRIADGLVEHRPDYILGYSVALARFAEANSARGPQIRRLGVRLVVAAAEAFPSPDARRRVADLFGCPVAMEYGSVETNLVAHEDLTGRYRVFWRSYLLEAAPSVDGRSSRLLVTSLYPRKFPLVRYELGDEVVLGEEQLCPSPVTSFDSVRGRCNDYVQIPGSAQTLHSEVFSHAVRPCGSVIAFQVHVERAGISLWLLTPALSSEDEDGIRTRLRRIAPALANVRLHVVSELARSVAGKTPMIVNEGSC